MLARNADRTTSVKTLTVTLAVASALSCLTAGPAAFAQQPSSTCTYTESIDVPAGMRDGTILRSNVFTPNEPGTYPVILLRLPYDKDVTTARGGLRKLMARRL
jgi:predicted acyl esterase